MPTPCTPESLWIASERCGERDGSGKCIRKRHISCGLGAEPIPEICRDGTVYRNVQCAYCPPEFYKSVLTPTACTRCPQGTSTGLGSSSVGHTSVTGCKPCPHGTRLFFLRWTLLNEL